jgi:hypothetical protein
MSQYLQPGLHPDPDSLNALIEGALPEHERLACLTHLSECPVCREVVYLAQEPVAGGPEPVSVAGDKISFWKRWFTPIPALSAAALAGLLVLSVAVYRREPAVHAPELVAGAPPATESAFRTDAATPSLMISPPRPKTSPDARFRVAPPAVQKTARDPEPRRTATITGPAAITVPATALYDAPLAGLPLPLSGRGVPLITVPSVSSYVATSNASPGAQSGITGTITDPAGASIPGAAVRLRLLAGTASRNASTDTAGQFNVAGLQPGRYELLVTAPGFQQTTKQIDVQPEQTARGDSTLPVGSVSETVSVEASSVSINTRSSRPAGEKSAVRLLEDRRPADTTVVSGKLMLRMDSTGALFRSENAGKEWKAIKPVWQGSVVGLVAIAESPSSSGPAFRLTTSGGATWLSRDGSHWYAAPTQ